LTGFQNSFTNTPSSKFAMPISSHYKDPSKPQRDYSKDFSSTMFQHTDDIKDCQSEHVDGRVRQIGSKWWMIVRRTSILVSVALL